MSIWEEFAARFAGQTVAHYVADKPGRIRVEQVDEQAVVSIRAQSNLGQLAADLGGLQRRLVEFMGDNHLAPTSKPLSVFHTPLDEDMIDLEACVPVPEVVNTIGEIESRMLPGGEMAMVNYRGPYTKRMKFLKPLIILMDGQGIQPGPGIREECLVGPLDVDKPKKFLTCVIWPTGK